jgi:hypothetical protein
MPLVLSRRPCSGSRSDKVHIRVFEVTCISLKPEVYVSSLVYRLVHAPVTRESWVRLPGEEFFLLFFQISREIL